MLLAAERRAGRPPSAAEIRGALEASALDLGVPGPDQVFGIGRVRVNVDPPRVARPTPAPLASVRGRVSVTFTGLSRSRISTWTLDVDGRPATPRAQTYPRGITIDTRHLADGWHALRATARDYPGNVGALDWSVKVDNTQAGAHRPLGEGAAPAPAPAARRGPGPAPRAPCAWSSRWPTPGSTGRLQATITAARRGAEHEQPRVIGITPGQRRTVVVGRLAKGAYAVRVSLADRAGNAVTVTRSVTVR